LVGPDQKGRCVLLTHRKNKFGGPEGGGKGEMKRRRDEGANKFGVEHREKRSGVQCVFSNSK